MNKEKKMNNILSDILKSIEKIVQTHKPDETELSLCIAENGKWVVFVREKTKTTEFCIETKNDITKLESYFKEGK